MNTQQKISELERRVDALVKRHNASRREIAALRDELHKLKTEVVKGEKVELPSVVEAPEETPITHKPLEHSTIVQASTKPPIQSTESNPETREDREARKRNVEQFIGGKLINFIGIGILVLGVSMGIKYAIDQDLMGPLIRVILGGIAGLGLVFVAWRLKEKYSHYSAVMLGGGVAILYFDTFAAYDFYQLLPHTLAFSLMLVITIFTVWAAVLYDLQIIGIIGLVGAYAVPILLSQDSGRAHILFLYMSIINGGILLLAFRKNWRLLNHCTFALSWMIFMGWYVSNIGSNNYMLTTITFSSVFFLIFYGSFLAYKLIHFEKFAIKDVILLLLNAFIYYAIGYDWVTNFEGGHKWLGLFTLGHAIIHFGVSMLIHSRKQADKNVYYLIMALVLTFLTIAIPVQLDGNWVTMLWILMGVAAFYIGHFRDVPTYKYMAYGLVALGVLSLFHDWAQNYPQGGTVPGSSFTFLFNITFNTSLLVVGGLSAIYWIYKNKKISEESDFSDLIGNNILPALILGISYLAVFFEISQFAYSRYYLSEAIGNDLMRRNESILDFRQIWLMIYSFIYLSAFSLVNHRFFKSKVLGQVGVVAGFIAVAFCFLEGSSTLLDLRNSFLNEDSAYTHGWEHIGIRYLVYICLASCVYVSSFQVKLTEWWEERESFWQLLMYLIAYFIIFFEISELTYVRYYLSEQIRNNFPLRNEVILDFRQIWLIAYTFIYLSVLGILNHRFHQSKIIGRVGTVAGLITVAFFFTGGMATLNDLRTSFLDNEAVYAHGWGHIGIRYLAYICLAACVYVSSTQIKIAEWWEEKKHYWHLLMHLIILIVLSNELSNSILIISEQAAQSLAYKVGYSLLWASYALLLIMLGIRQKIPVFRYAAFVLIGVTLIKIFFFDLSNTPTLSRIMIFIGVGGLLMLGAYLYQRYKEEM